MRKQTQIMYIRHEPPYITGGKDKVNAKAGCLKWHRNIIMTQNQPV